MDTIPLIVITGPTASGKSDLAIHLAKKWKGEIVSADSRQVYLGLDIGSGKVTKRERKMLPHHCLDIKKPCARFSLAQYKRCADRAIHDIARRGKLPFLVGGTWLYIKAVVENYSIPRVPPHHALRKKLDALPLDTLLFWLSQLDVKTFNTIDRKNRRRVSRALEVTVSLQKPFSSVQKKAEPHYQPLLLCMDVDRKELYEHIDRRVDSRMRQGMVAEVASLLAHGVQKKWLMSLGLEYRFMTEYLSRDRLCTREELSEALKGAVHDFARRQLVWFRKEKNLVPIRSLQDADRHISQFLRHAIRE